MSVLPLGQTMMLKKSATLLSAATAIALLSGNVPALAQGYDAELRVQQLEQRLRTLTGQNEELQHRNRQLEEQLRNLQAGAPGQGAATGAAPVQPAQVAPRADAVGAPLQTSPQYQQHGGAPAPIVYDQAPPQAQPQGGGRRRNDAFNPAANPDAPGVPRALGGGQLPIPAAQGGGAAVQTSPGGPAPARGNAPTSIAGLTTLPPSGSARDEFDLGIGYMQRRDYALAEETLKNFGQRHPEDPLVGEAQYWLGESYYQRKMYREAAEAFLGVTTTFDTNAKAPDSLLRLGQSLAALKETEAACAAFSEIGRKYPRAAQGVKQAVDREQKRNKC